MKERRERNFRILEFRENKFDIIGDVHGCYDELMELIERLGYEKKDSCYTHPEGRRLISVGDVADKGCQNLACLDFWIEQVNNGGAFWVHGGLRPESIGKFSNKIRAVCLYGETTGNFDENGKPERLDWAAEYDGQPFVVYGHTVAERPEIINRTVDIDQGCVYGGYLTALRYPEIEFVQVRGKKYAEYHGGGKVPEE